MAKETKATSDELQRFVPAGLKWLYEMEAVNSPVLLNNLYGNIFSFPNVNDAEILIDRNHRKMLILIQFNWISRKIFKNRKKETTIYILDQLQELLPSFEFRVIEDRALFDLAVKRMSEAAMGGTNGPDIKKPDSSAPAEPATDGGADAIASGVQAPTETTTTESQPEAVETDSEKQTKD